jgi:hypothetical protein
LLTFYHTAQSLYSKQAHFIWGRAFVISQEEEFAHAVENQYVPADVDIYEDSDDGF